MSKTIKDNRFTTLGSPKRIWAISAIHGEVDKLTALHDALLEHIRPGDKIIYLGNYIGYGERAVESVDEILAFRRLVLAQPAMMAHDLIYLRGTQEEMWQKLLQIQFAPNPADVLLWMLGNGLSNTLYAYGLSPHDGIEACRAGVMGLTKWTGKIRETVRNHPGHEIFGTQLLRAAHTNEDADYPMLFVHAGIDGQKSLSDQNDNFWWAGKEFEAIDAPYAPFEKVVRGYDPDHGGIKMNCITATIDGGCGFGGPLVCAGFDQSGDSFQMLEA
ncbi:MAG: hypothetical protein DHS20C02_03240 [Micavibrio sp.]|nr:MAG: hypothetical protein DHS20C02_03240 [Micavibrio sp.]